MDTKQQLTTLPSELDRIIERNWQRLKTASQYRTRPLIESSTALLNESQRLRAKYHGYQANGFLLLGVTLRTPETSDSIARSDYFWSMCEKYFPEQLHRRIPKRLKSLCLFDYDFILEKSDPRAREISDRKVIASGVWHFHGLVAIHPSVSDLFWKDHQLNRHLRASINSFEVQGKYRPCRIDSFDIQPVRSVDDWVNYILKRRQEKIHFH